MPDTPCQLVRRAFTTASNRVRVARWIGDQAVTIARRELVGAFHAGAVRPSPDSVVETSAPPPPSGATTAGRTSEGSADDPSVGAPFLEDLPDGPPPPSDGVVPAPAVAPVNGRSAAAATVVAAAADDSVGSGLPPFEGYDTLPAAHIVQRLGRLTAEDLAIVRAYELDHRARRTVVAKVDQLLDA